MTVAVLGLEVQSGQVQQATPALERLTAAARNAEAAAKGLAGASRVEEVAEGRATAAARMHTAALQAQSAASRMSANTNRMLAFQINDIATSLASGMNPAMIAAQQGGQILQLGLANVARSLGSLTAAFAPVLAAAAALGVGLAALTTEFNKNSEVQIGFMDVLQAGWELLSENVLGALQPIIDWFAGMWSTITPYVVNGINVTIGLFAGAVEAIKSTWSLLPQALGDIVFTAAESVVNGIVYMINSAIAELNGFLHTVNGLANQAGMGKIFGDVGKIDPVDLYNPFEGAAGKVAGNTAGAFSDALSTDWVGMWGDRAEAIAKARGELEKTGKAADRVGSVSLPKIAEQANAVGEALTGAFKGMGSGLLDKLIEGGNVLQSILDGLLDRAQKFAGAMLDKVFDTGLNSLFGGAGGGGNLLSSLFGGGVGGGPIRPGFNLPGFANGGQGVVSGTGGTDSKIFVARVTPGEPYAFGANAVRGMGGSPANTNFSFHQEIINNTSAQVRTTEVDDGRGGKRQQIVIDEMQASNVGRTGSATQRAMKTAGRRRLA